MLLAWSPANTVAPLLPPSPTMSSPGFRFVLVGFAAAAARPARIAKRRIGAAGSGSIGALRQRPSVAASMRRAGSGTARAVRRVLGCRRDAREQGTRTSGYICIYSRRGDRVPRLPTLFCASCPKSLIASIDTLGLSATLRLRAFWRQYCCQCGATGAAHEPKFKEGSPCKPQMARTCEEVSLKSSYALVAAGVVLGSLAHGGALYWCLVLMVALFAAAVSVYKALVDENARLYFERREKSAPVIRILIRALVEGPDESRREAARDLATRAAEKAFDRDLIASEGACPPLVALCRRGETDETRGAAAAALGNLAANALIRKRTLPASGAVDALLALCRSPCDDGDGARSACTALRNMAFDAETKATIAEAGGVEVACSLLRRPAPRKRGAAPTPYKPPRSWGRSAGAPRPRRSRPSPAKPSRRSPSSSRPSRRTRPPRRPRPSRCGTSRPTAPRGAPPHLRTSSPFYRDARGPTAPRAPRPGAPSASSPPTRPPWSRWGNAAASTRAPLH